MVSSGNRAAQQGLVGIGAAAWQRFSTDAVERDYRPVHSAASNSDHYSQGGQVMKWFAWLHPSSREIVEAKENSRVNRGALTHKIIELEEHRHMLDEMVKKSLALMEAKRGPDL